VLAAIAASYGLSKLDVSEGKHLITAAAAGIAAGIMGPEVLAPPVSEYLHHPTFYGLALGTIGVAGTAAAVGGALGLAAGEYTDFDDHGGILAAPTFALYGAIGATALYWGSQALNYFGG
jgi:hypothetical protein